MEEHVVTIKASTIHNDQRCPFSTMVMHFNVTGKLACLQVRGGIYPGLITCQSRRQPFIFTCMGRVKFGKRNPPFFKQNPQNKAGKRNIYPPPSPHTHTHTNCTYAYKRFKKLPKLLWDVTQVEHRTKTTACAMTKYVQQKIRFTIFTG